MILRCLIVDDDQKSIDLIARYIGRRSDMEVVFTTTDPFEALHGIINRTIEVDIAFLDIEMPKISGLDLAGLIMNFTFVVFITGYPEKETAAINQDVMIDFIVKPVLPERFEACMKRVRKEIELKESQPTFMEEDSLFISQGIKTRYTKILLKDIIYVEGASNYILIHLADKTHMPHMTLRAMEEVFEGKPFVRIHKSFIININKISEIKGNSVIMENGFQVDITKTYSDAFFERMKPLLPKGRNKS